MLARCRLGLTLLTLGLLAGVGATPAGAAQAVPPGFNSSNPIPSPGAFSVPGSHGYTISVFADTNRKRPRVLVSAVSRSGRVSVSAPADLSNEGIRADLGRYGRIDMAWVPNGQAEEGKTRCRTVPPTPIWFAGGQYAGTFSFHGEKGFTDVEVGSVDGREGWWRYSSCGYTVSEGYPGPGFLLEAQRSADGPAYRYLSAVQNSRGGKVSFVAGMGELDGPLGVSRSAYVLVGRGALKVDDKLDRAEVRPPAPFSGRGVFDRIARRGPGTWRGNLTVDFPGRSDVSLVGRRWTASLVRGSREIEMLRLANVCSALSGRLEEGTC